MTSFLELNEFEEKYRQFSQMIFNIAFVYFNSKENAEDIMQDTFIEYLTSKKTFKSFEHEKRWLIRSAINNCKDLSRKNKRLVSLDEQMIEEYSFSKEREAGSDELISQIVSLDEKYRKVIILFYYNDLSIKEIALVLKTSSAAIKKQLERGRKALRERMMKK